MLYLKLLIEESIGFNFAAVPPEVTFLFKTPDLCILGVDYDDKRGELTIRGIPDSAVINN